MDWDGVSPEFDFNSDRDSKQDGISGKIRKKILMRRLGVLRMLSRRPKSFFWMCLICIFCFFLKRLNWYELGLKLIWNIENDLPNSCCSRCLEKV